MNMKHSFQKTLPHLGAIVLFLVIVIVYFYPAFEGKVLQQSDITQFEGMSKELIDYGKPSGWTGSMFSGMPSYHITGYSTGYDFIAAFKGHVLGALQSETAAPILILLLASYILFLVMGAPVWLSILGAIATAFSSYNIIIIVAGHVTKAWALAFVPLIIAGMLLVFRRKYWVGLIIFSFALALEIVSNHLQIAYYAALFCAILYIGFLVFCFKEKTYKHLGVTTGIFSLSILLAVGANLSNLYTNYESSQESLRGKAELTPKEGTKNVSTGLDKDYAFQWSYGKGETLSLLIPNVMGGNSGGELSSDSHLYKELKSQGAQVGKTIQSYTYWGEKPFTAGPVYFGAIVCFLFLFAFFIVSGSNKWWLLGVSVFFIFLAWGKNLAWFNDFLFYHLPYYSKFRTPETALVIPAFTFPMLAVMAIKELLSKELKTEKLKKSLYLSAGITGGICFILWIIPGMFFNFQSSFDAQYGLPDWYYDALIKDRKALLQADALRSLIFIVLSAALIFLYIKAKDPKKVLGYVAAGLVLLVLCDMWQIDKRYLNTSNFVSQKANKEVFQKTVADNEILQDPALSYRVLNLNNPFQEARTSYYHKSIGGYHAAKLRRYQDLIDNRLMKETASIISVLTNNPTAENVMNALENSPSLNMLNTKYIIYDPGQAPIFNPYADGNAWFVDSYRFVNNPDEEMAALETLNPLKEAVLDKKFAENLQNLPITPDSTAHIAMTSYAPNAAEYKSSSQKEGLVVFSEVYYEHGWKAFVDEKQVPISRADWTLRAIVVPAGEHQIKFVFDPEEVRTCGTITTIMSGILMLLVIGGLIYFIYRKIK